ncbi:MAG: hypothetical protein ACRAVC_25255, partial [Trichormus sp.]
MIRHNYNYSFFNQPGIYCRDFSAPLASSLFRKVGGRGAGGQGAGGDKGDKGDKERSLSGGFLRSELRGDK